MRGSGEERVESSLTIDLWIKYNNKMIEKFDREWSDGDFCPYLDSHNWEPRLAVLQRSTLLLLHRAYERGALHLDRYLTLLGSSELTEHELFAASYLLGNRHGIANLLEPDNPLKENIKSRHVPILLRAAFATELRWRLRNALRELDRALFVKLIVLGVQTFGWLPMMLLPFQKWHKRRAVRRLGPAEDF